MAQDNRFENITKKWMTCDVDELKAAIAERGRRVRCPECSKFHGISDISANIKRLMNGIDNIDNKAFLTGKRQQLQWPLPLFAWIQDLYTGGFCIIQDFDQEHRNPVLD